ncbi:dTDP-4-dehydrorhamnose 3,5-epimerase [Dysgonomonas sp.]
MKFTEQKIKGVWVIEPKVFTDTRGYFMETYKRELFEQHIGKVEFIQDNESRSTKGVLRGLHFQTGEYSQAKLVRVIKGQVLDVAVDLRRSSSTYGQHIAIELSEENKKQLFIPRDFAHGFLVLNEDAIFSYKVDNVYSPKHEKTILWNDPTLDINWGMEYNEIILTEKDRIGQFMVDSK